MKKILILSDLHTGSVFGLFPPNFKTSDGTKIKLNEVQSHLYYHFKNFKEKVKKIGYDLVILLGDLIDGLNIKQYGKYTLPTDYDIQIDACVKLLEDICQNKKVIGISGSGYHTSNLFSSEKVIIERLNGEFLGVIKTINYAGYNINLSHGVSSAVIYRLTLMDREVLFSQIAEGLDKIHKIDIFLRGHWHFGVFIHYPTFKKYYIQVPCWQAFVPVRPYLVLYGRTQPDVGGVILFLDKKTDYVRPIFLIYPNPKYHL